MTDTNTVADPFIPKTGSDRELHAFDEWFHGAINDVAVKPAVEDKFGNDNYVWKIRLDGEDDDVWFFTTAYLADTPKNKLHKLIVDVTGEKPSLAPPPNVRNLLVGKRVKVMFDAHTKQDGTPTEKIVALKASGQPAPSEEVPF